MKVLVVGSGAREHALYWKIRQSPLVKRVICSPGNTGIPIEDRRDVKVAHIEGLARLAIREHVDLVVVGPEVPLVAGLVDRLHEEAPKISVFGPTAQAARLEGSKIFTKLMCRQWGIPTANFATPDTFASAQYIIDHTGYRVIKADGLCGGKGVTVADTADESVEAARALFADGAARIVVEDRLIGYELSVIVLCDGENIICLPVAQDYKRLLDGDKGPNTGGMGAYCPVHVDDALLAEIKERIIMPTLRGMAARGTPFHGALYAGIMVTKDGPKLLEYNVRLGDPETQAILPLIKSDIVPYLIAPCEKGGLANMPPLEAHPWRTVCTVLVPRGYPGKHETGFSIYGLNEVDPRVTIFHGGMELRYYDAITVDERLFPVTGLVATGGRTLSVVGFGATFESASRRSRDAASLIVRRSDGKLFYRNDIGYTAA